MGTSFAELGRAGIIDTEQGSSARGLEEFKRFYDDGRAVSFFTDYRPSPEPGRDKFNRNALEAEKMVANIISNEGGGIGMVTGPMSASKTSLGVLLTERFPQLQVFQHSGDGKRFPSDYVTTQADGGWETDVYRKGYTHLSDLREKDGIRFGPGEVVFIDEFGFINRDEDIDPPEMNRFEFFELLDVARYTRTFLVLSLLDFDFAARAWPNADVANGEVDFRVVLASRCVDNCGRPSFLTQRNTVLPDGRVRPSHSGEEVYQVDSVITNTYQPKCFEDHKVLSSDEAELFDSGG